MRAYLIRALRTDIGGFTIRLFDAWHITYLLLIFGIALGLYFLWRGKDAATRRKSVSRCLVITVCTYALDFFVMPLYTDGIAVDKLPFHICTALSILACFGQFHPKCGWLKTPAVVLSIVAPMMYLCYPGTALIGVSPLSYQVLQTFFYHGALFCYGFLSVSLGEVELHMERVKNELALIVGIALWAGFGNYLFNDGTRHFDWFFLTGSTFPFVPARLMPLVVIACVFGVVLCVYGVYYLCKYLAAKYRAGYAHI